MTNPTEDTPTSLGGLEQPKGDVELVAAKSVTAAHILKRLNEWNFKYHVRHCMLNPLKYGGTDPYEVEEWSNKELANLLVEDVINDLIATGSSQDKVTPSRPGEHKKQELEGKK